MPVPYLGTFDVVSTGWIGRRDVFVDFVTDRTDRLHQLYAGRHLIGCTSRTTDRRVSGLVPPNWGQSPLVLLSVAPVDRLVDFGSVLPQWPTAHYSLRWSASGFPADARRFVIAASPAAGAAVDPGHVVGQVRARGDGDYEFDLPPISECGAWEFSVTPYDDAGDDGNAGDVETVAIVAVIPPEDLVPDADGNRFTAETESGILAVSFTYPS